MIDAMENRRCASVGNKWETAVDAVARYKDGTEIHRSKPGGLMVGRVGVKEGRSTRESVDP